MIVIVAFMVVLAGFAGWWLLHQGLAAKPWLEVGIPQAADWHAPAQRPIAKLGLAAFLAVAGSLFALLVSAYFMRMGMADWRMLPMPIVLWFSTGLLMLSSLALQATVAAARRGELDGIRSGLLAAGVSALAFLAGQLLAWRELADTGYFTASNPAGASRTDRTTTSAGRTPRSRVASAAAGERSDRPGTAAYASGSRSACATCPRACTPASVRPATTRRTGSGARTTVVSAADTSPSTVRRPGWAAQPEKSVPS